MSELPRYDDLPVRTGVPAGSSWGLWGDGDVFGTLNLLRPESVVAAARLIRRGALFPVNFDAELPDPPLFGRAAPAHEVTGAPDAGSHDDIVTFNTQSSSQWDGFRHIRSPFGYYSGLQGADHGVHHWARRGIAGRAVLADVGRHLEREGRPLRYDQPDPIEPADVEGALEEQGSDLRPGDILLIRTGWIGWYRSLDAGGRAALATELRTPGLMPGEATARFLWDSHIAAVAADNPALECWPPGFHRTQEERNLARADPARRMDLFVHLSILPLLGIPIGELWDLEAFSEDCAADGSYEAFLASAPLNIRGAAASPPNALLIK